MIARRLLGLTLALMAFASSAAPVINTIAGGGTPHGSATGWGMTPSDAVTDAAGNTYVSVANDFRVLKIDPSGQVTNYAGTGRAGYSGDGGPASSAQLNYPQGLALDAAGNLYIADSNNARIRRVMAATGTITTVAGNGLSTYSGDGGPATSAGLYYPSGVAVDAAGTVIYIADTSNNRIRRAIIGGTISTFAGGAAVPPTGQAGTAWGVNGPGGVAVDASGNVYFSVIGDNAVLKLSTGGSLSVIAGTGAAGSTGDGGPATSATLYAPRGIALDASGNLLIADSNNYRVRRVNLTTGTIATIAGNGSYGFAGDGGPAVSARLSQPYDVAADSAGNVYIADYNNSRIRMVGSGGTISTVAGSATAGYSGDGGMATAAQISNPAGVAVSSDGTLYIADYGNCRIRQVSGGNIVTVVGTATCAQGGDGTAGASTPTYYPIAVEVDGAGNVYFSEYYFRVRKLTAGVVSTIAGVASATGFSDGSPATGKLLNYPAGLAVDTSSNVYIADYYNNRVRKVSGTTISTIAGAQGCCFGGDGYVATQARLNQPLQVALDSSGNLFVADYGNHRIRKVDAGGAITTYAGSGTAGFGGDGGPATSASLNSPRGVSVDATGNVLIADSSNRRVRIVNAASNVISTVAGSSSGTLFGGDGGPATSASLSLPSSARMSPAGSVIIADTNNYRVRRVTSGTISTMAGNGWPKFSGDSGPAIDAQLNSPVGVVADAAGNVYFSDYGNHRVRRIDAATGVVTTVAGNGNAGFNGDNIPATSASLYTPRGLALDSAGNLYIADANNYRVRKVVVGGNITTVIGNGCGGYNGDGIAATSACIYYPTDVAVDSAGNVFAAEYYSHRVRRRDSSTGLISTVAGTGSGGFNGDNQPATAATLYYPFGIAVDASGTLFIADSSNYRIRKVSSGTITTIAGNGGCSISNNVPAVGAYICHPYDVDVDQAGNVFLSNNYGLVQRVDGSTGYLNTVAGNASYGFSGDGGPATSAALTTAQGVSARSGAVYISDTNNDRIRKVTGLDVSGPSIVANVAGTLGTNGWYRGNVSVSWAVTDPDSAIQTSSGCGTSSVTVDTAGTTFTCQATSSGGSTSQSVVVKRDATKPTIVLAARTPTANGYGWNNSDVTVQFSGTDVTSGIGSCTNAAVISAEGAGQSVVGTCADNAGNTSDPLTIGAINVDKTAPSATAVATPAMNGAGWNKTAVTVTFSGTDALSGIASCTAPAALSVEGTGQGAAGTCTDKAGNVSPEASVAGINIDFTKPVAVASVTPGPNGYGWNDDDVVVSFSATDAGSGIASCESPVTLSAEAAGLFASGTCIDVAGNVSDPAVAAGINIDKTAPVVNATASPAPGASGWNTGPVTVSYTGSDVLSGVVAGDCDPDQVLSADGSGQSATGGCTDRAGNRGTATLAGIKIDRTPPTATASTSPPPNGAGWNNSDVTVSFAGTDSIGGSGLDGCTSPAVLSAEGINLGASGQCSDVAGNVSTVAAVSGINIDKTPPAASANATPGANANGWRKTDVTVSFSATDGLSGFANCSPAVILSGEGAGQSASGTCTDVAGNSSTVAANGINIDKTPPAITSSNSPPPNGNGWNSSDVTVSFAGNDTLSGVDDATCTAPGVISVEGAGQTTSGTCADKAGNVATPVTSAAVSIDKTPPVATATNSPGPNADGWNNTTVTVSFGGSDSLSGIDSSTCTSPVPFSAEGTGFTATGSCRDKAGNQSATVSSPPFSIDKTAPLVTGSASPAPNGSGWNNTVVTVTFVGTDAGGSGIPLGGCVSPAPLSADGVNQSASGQCTDRAGNSGSATVTGINIDRTPPDVVATATPGPNGNGWNNTNVVVSYSATEDMTGSGVLSCSAPTTLSTEGAGQSASGTCSDKAGNSASATKTGVKIDKTPPVVAIATPADAATYAAGSTVNASYSCNDSLSGIAGCAGPVPSGSPISTTTAGSAAFSVNATDLAGNAASRTNSYTVAAGYTFIGFQQPVDNLPTLNSATAGRVIPIKWQLKDSAGNYVSSLSTFTSMLQQTISCDASPEDIVEEQLTSPGSTVLRYDSTTNQFIFNWQTTKGWSGCRVLQLTLSDGSKQYAKFKFR